MLKQLFQKVVLVAVVITVITTSKAPGINAGSGSVMGDPLDELAALLPPSHIVGVLDMPRAARDLLPRLRSNEGGNLARLARDIEQFIKNAGLDPDKVTSAVVGLRMEGINVRGGVLIADGVALDPKLLESSARNFKLQFETFEINGKQAYRVIRLKPVDPANPQNPPVKDGELKFASLGGKRFAVGDREGITAVLQPTAGQADSNGVQWAAIKETRPAALLRFGVNLPEGLREVLKSQGELFEQLAGIKVIFGTMDITAEKDAAIDSRLRAKSKEEAAQMQEGLKSLVFLGKSFLSGDQDPRYAGISQLLDQIKIASDAADVTLYLKIPSSVLDSLMK